MGREHHEVIDAGPPEVLVHRASLPDTGMLFLHNLANRPCRVDLSDGEAAIPRPLNILADGDYGRDLDLGAVELNGYGYRWIRLA